MQKFGGTKDKTEKVRGQTKCVKRVKKTFLARDRCFYAFLFVSEFLSLRFLIFAFRRERTFFVFSRTFIPSLSDNFILIIREFRFNNRSFSVMKKINH